MGTTTADFASDFSDCTRLLDEDLRVDLWNLVWTYLFGAAPLSVPQVWTAEPIGGNADRMPEDVEMLLEGWFALVEPADVMRFLDAVATALPPSLGRDFVRDCHDVLGGLGSLAALRVA